MKLKELGTIVTGNTPSKSNVEFYNSNDINFYKPSDFIENELNVLDSSEEYISNSAKSKARMIPKNSVMMTCIGTIGKIGITTKESTCNQQINAIVANEMVDSKYLGYKLLSIKDLLIKKANAPVVPILNKTDFSNIEISIHEKNEQLRIVSKLDKLNILLKLKKEEIEKCNQLIKSQFVDFSYLGGVV